MFPNGSVYVCALVCIGMWNVCVIPGMNVSHNPFASVFKSQRFLTSLLNNETKLILKNAVFFLFFNS